MTHSKTISDESDGNKNVFSHTCSPWIIPYLASPWLVWFISRNAFKRTGKHVFPARKLPDRVKLTWKLKKMIENGFPSWCFMAQFVASICACLKMEYTPISPLWWFWWGRGMLVIHWNWDKPSHSTKKSPKHGPFSAVGHILPAI